MTGCGIMLSVWGMILLWGSTIKVSIELPVATRHRRDMTEKLLEATLNPNKQQQYPVRHNLKILSSKELQNHAKINNIRTTSLEWSIAKTSGGLNAFYASKVFTLSSDMGHVMRKPDYAIGEQQRHRSACAFAQSDQHHCCSLPR